MPRIHPDFPLVARALIALLACQTANAGTTYTQPGEVESYSDYHAHYFALDCVEDDCEMPWVADATGMSVTPIDAPIQLDPYQSLLRLGDALSGSYRVELFTVDPNPDNVPMTIRIGSTRATVSSISDNGWAQFDATRGEEYYLFLFNGSFEAASQRIVTITPVPEPAEWALMLAGLGLVGWRARRDRNPRRAHYVRRQ